MDNQPSEKRKDVQESRYCWQAAVWCATTLTATTVFRALLPANVIQFSIIMWTPTIVAIIFLLVEGVPLRAGLNLRASSRPALIAAVTAPLVVAVIAVAIGLTSGHLTLSGSWRFQPVGAFLTLLIWIASSLGEELGWRGYLHNHLRGFRHAPVAIGLVWAAWHSEHLATALRERPYLAGVFILAVVETSYVLSWMIETGGGIFSVGIYHGIWNFLRMKVLFGNPQFGVPGLFATDATHLTELEGVFGLIGLTAVAAPFIHAWYWGQTSFLTSFNPPNQALLPTGANKEDH